MRVLHVISNLGTYGAERFLGLLLERFDEAEIELGVLTVEGARAPRPALYPVFEAHRRDRADPLFLARMIAAVRKWRPNIVHTHTHHGKYWGRIAAVAAGVPKIVHTEHNSEFGAPAPFRLLNRALVSRTDAVVTFSPAQSERLAREERILPSKLFVIPNGIALLSFDPTARATARARMGAKHDDLLIVNVGRLAAVKNQQLAIEMLAALPLDCARLVLIGEGANRGALERLTEQRGLSARVVFLGYRDDASLLIAGADIALVTSLNEAMPLSIIEAMNSRTPLVSVPWNGARAMLGDGDYGLVAQSYNPMDVGATVREVLADPTGARERANSAFAHAREEYDISTTVRRHAKLYRALNCMTRTATGRLDVPRS